MSGTFCDAIHNGRVRVVRGSLGSNSLDPESGSSRAQWIVVDVGISNSRCEIKASPGLGWFGVGLMAGFEGTRGAVLEHDRRESDQIGDVPVANALIAIECRDRLC